MKRIQYILLVGIFLNILVACKSSKAIVSNGEATNISAKKIIKNHYKNALNFNTLRGKLRVKYDDGKQSEGFTLSLRMKKDEAIWLSAKLSIVKVYITPSKVSFYNRLDNTYFEGDFSLISRFIGTDLNFEKVQNLLLGDALFNLKSERFQSEIQDKAYQLTPKKQLALFERLFLISPSHFKIMQERFVQASENRTLTIQYPEYQDVAQQIVPKKLVVKADEPKKQTTIDVEYKNISLNEKVRFPFKIPNGFKAITID